MTSRRELKNYAKQAMSGKYGILILAFVAVQALALISSMISSALFPGEETIDIVLSLCIYIYSDSADQCGSGRYELYVSEYCQRESIFIK